MKGAKRRLGDSRVSEQQLRDLLGGEKEPVPVRQSQTEQKQLVTVVPRDGSNRTKINQMIKKYVIHGNNDFNAGIDQIPAIVPENQLLLNRQVLSCSQLTH